MVVEGSSRQLLSPELRLWEGSSMRGFLGLKALWEPRKTSLKVGLSFEGVEVQNRQVPTLVDGWWG